MAGPRLITIILTALAVILTAILVIVNVTPSWSQYALTAFVPIFNVAISSMATIFFFRDTSHVSRNYSLFKLFGMDIRIKQISRFTAFMFLGIIATPVTYGEMFPTADMGSVIKFLHFTFTFLAIGSAYLQFMFHERTLRTYILSAVGCVGFAVGFFTNIYTIGVGEMFAAIPIAYFIYDDINFIKS